MNKQKFIDKLGILNKRLKQKGFSALILVIIGVTLLAIPLSIFLVKQQTQLKSKATVGSNPSGSPVPGDATGDGCVSDEDKNCWRTRSGNSADFNRNNKTDLIDYTIWLDAFNSGHYACTGTVSSTCVNH